MRDRDEDTWISISDLMAGVVAAAMLLFVHASLEATRESASLLVIERRLADERERSRQQLRDRRARIDVVLAEISRNVRDTGLTGSVEVDTTRRIIRLRETTFTGASACVRDQARAALLAWAPEIKRLLEENPEVALQVEGHSDNVPLSEHEEFTEDFLRRRCALFDDNYTLSAARAREARAVMVGEKGGGVRWDDALRRRVAVVGYGSSQPLLGRDPEDPINRRVEIHIRDLSTPDTTDAHEAPER